MSRHRHGTREGRRLIGQHRGGVLCPVWIVVDDARRAEPFVSRLRAGGGSEVNLIRVNALVNRRLLKRVTSCQIKARAALCWWPGRCRLPRFGVNIEIVNRRLMPKTRLAAKQVCIKESKQFGQQFELGRFFLSPGRHIRASAVIPCPEQQPVVTVIASQKACDRSVAITGADGSEKSPAYKRRCHQTFRS